MPDAYVIEVKSAAAGLVVRAHDRHGFRFFAAVPEFSGLEGRCFRNPQDAERAAERHAHNRSERNRPHQRRG
jgi:hypothetical protein